MSGGRAGSSGPQVIAEHGGVTVAIVAVASWSWVCAVEGVGDASHGGDIAAAGGGGEEARELPDGQAEDLFGASVASDVLEV